MFRFQLNPQQIRDFEVIRDAGGATIDRIVARIRQLSPVPLKPSDLLPAVSDAVDGRSDIAESVVRQILAICGIMRQSGINSQDAVTALGATLENQSGWQPSDLAKWNSLRPSLESLLELRAVEIVATAIELSYEYANLYNKCRILTDIRPLFSRDASAIEGAVVSFTLRLHFDNADGDHDLSIAMDAEDVHELAQQCERALVKASTAHELLTSSNVPNFVTGTSGND